MLIRFIITKRNDIDLYALYYGLGDRGFRQVVENSLLSFFLGERERPVPDIIPEFPETVPDRMMMRITINNKNLEERLSTVINGKKSQMIRNVIRYYSLGKTGYIYFENGFGENAEIKQGNQIPSGIVIQNKTSEYKAKRKEQKRAETKPSVIETEHKTKNTIGTVQKTETAYTKEKVENKTTNSSGDDLDTLMSMFGDI